MNTFDLWEFRELPGFYSATLRDSGSCIRLRSRKAEPFRKTKEYRNTLILWLTYCLQMATIAKVSSKGQIVIPADIRKKLGSPKAMTIEERNGRVILVPTLTFQEAFGVDGKAGAQIASEISKDRRREVESERA